jgi:hypothetical protein
VTAEQLELFMTPTEQAKILARLEYSDELGWECTVTESSISRLADIQRDRIAMCLSELASRGLIEEPVSGKFRLTMDGYSALRQMNLSDESTPSTDVKEALHSTRKPDITHIRTPLLTYGTRGCEYGTVKYERGNYLKPTASLRYDFIRLRAYVRSSVSHLMSLLDSMEAHQAVDPALQNDEAMKVAAFAADDDHDTTGKVGPSRLPHLCGAIASLNMAVTQAVNAGLLPADPGQPWVPKKEGDK